VAVLTKNRGDEPRLKKMVAWWLWVRKPDDDLGPVGQGSMSSSTSGSARWISHWH
jgi:hypothetical protein